MGFRYFLRSRERKPCKNAAYSVVLIRISNVLHTYYCDLWLFCTHIHESYDVRDARNVCLLRSATSSANIAIKVDKKVFEVWPPTAKMRAGTYQANALMLGIQYNWD